jgi:hypothetical protein
MKRNCWEFKKCGREPGGKHAKEHGVCPAAAEDRLESVHGGKKAGRACWVVAGTFCGGEVQGTFAKKLHDCQKCDFYEQVRMEEGDSLLESSILLEMTGWDRERLILELQKALSEVRRLSGLLPICAWCKKIRDERGHWKKIEEYITEHSDARFTHGACPECYERMKKEEED